MSQSNGLPDPTALVREQAIVDAIDAIRPSDAALATIEPELLRMAALVETARRAGVPNYDLARAIIDIADERAAPVADPAGVDRLVDAAGSPEKPRLKFRTIAELRELAEARPLEWIVRGLIGCGAVALLGAKPKVGKTTLLAALLVACERGDPFAGFTTSRASAVYLSEEPASLLVERCERFGVEQAVFLSREEFSALHSFADFIAEAAAECLRLGSKVLVVDTYARFARMGADQEKDAGATQAIMEAVLAAAAQGLAVVLVTHMRKGDGEEGEAFRGSTALTGAADILIELRRATDDLREVICYSRFAESPTEPVLLRLDGDTFELEQGQVESRGVESAKTKILTVLRTNGPLSRRDLFERVACRHQDRLAALAALLTNGSVGREGSGRRGDPHLLRFLVPGGSDEVPEPGTVGRLGVPRGGLPPKGVPPGTPTDLGHLPGSVSQGPAEPESEEVSAWAEF